MIDEWSGLADMLANLIEKYASVLKEYMRKGFALDDERLKDLCYQH